MAELYEIKESVQVTLTEQQGEAKLIQIQGWQRRRQSRPASIAVAAAAWAALVVAMFSHAYIWVHYFCTERPELRVIYG